MSGAHFRAGTRRVPQSLFLRTPKQKQFRVGSRVRSINDGAQGEIIELGKIDGEKAARVRWQPPVPPECERTWARLIWLRVIP